MRRDAETTDKLCVSAIQWHGNASGGIGWRFECMIISAISNTGPVLIRSGQAGIRSGWQEFWTGSTLLISHAQKHYIQILHGGTCSTLTKIVEYRE